MEIAEALVGMGMIYTKTHDGKQLRRELCEYEKAELLRKYHKQNTQGVESEVSEALRGNDVALIVDCHSFPSVLIRLNQTEQYHALISVSAQTGIIHLMTY